LAAVAVAALVPASVGHGAAAGRPLEYRWASGGEFGYNFDIEADTEDAVVRVKGSNVYRPAPTDRAAGAAGIATGTAFVVGSKGYLITCAHCVQGTTKILVKLGGKEVDAKVLEVDARHDVALVQIPLHNLPVLPLGDSTKTRLAEEVRVVGYPVSNMLGNSIKVTSGSIAGFVEHAGWRDIQVDAAINPGNSGGPLVNDRGEVIGVVNAKLTGLDVTSVGFAVPIEEARRLLDRRGIAVPPSKAGEHLAGPELAARVTPSVAFLTMTLGPGGVGAGKPYRLALHSTLETSRTVKTASRASTSPAKSESLDAKIVADTHGDALEFNDAPILPFEIGMQGLVGIERLPDLDQEKWQVKRVLKAVAVIPGAAHQSYHESARPGPHFPSRGGSFGPNPGGYLPGPIHYGKSVTVTTPVLEVSEYELGATSPDGTVSIKKQYELKSLPAKHGELHFRVSGEGSFQFDPRKGRVVSGRFYGTREYETDTGTTTMAVKYAYRLIDPASLPGGGAPTAVQPAEDAGAAARPVSPPPADREPVPGKAARESAAALVEDVYGDEIKAARSQAGKLALVDKLLAAADGEKKAAQRYALLNRARLLAITSGDLAATRRAADEMINSFQIDAEKANVAVLQAVAGTASGAQNGPVAQFAASLMEDSILADRFDLAEQLHGVAMRAAQKAKDLAMTRRLERRGKDLQRILEESRAIGDAQAALARNPGDPEANLTVGKFDCFTKRDWEKGLPLLARGSDAGLKAAAVKEAAGPGTADDRLELADLWWQLAEERPGNSQEAMRLRARKWYQEAVADLSGLGRASAEKRLAQLAKWFPPETPGEGQPAPAPAEPATTPRAARPSKSLPGSALPVAASNVRARTLETQVVGNGLDEHFTELAPAGGLLIGFDVGLGKWGSNDVIAALRPIFRTRQGSEVMGKLHGADLSRPIHIKAKSGYAVGVIHARGLAAVDGFSVVFMRVSSHGVLNSKGSYESPWVGGQGGVPTILNPRSAPVVGIVGAENDKNCTGLGLVLKP
jgi:hypothetical protein